MVNIGGVIRMLDITQGSGFGVRMKELHVGYLMPENNAEDCMAKFVDYDSQPAE